MLVQWSAGQSRADRWVGRERRDEAALLPFLLISPHSQALLPPLGASVLEPDLDLSLRQAEGHGGGVALQHRQIVAPLEAALQNPQLLRGEGGADPTTLHLERG